MLRRELTVLAMVLVAMVIAYIAGGRWRVDWVRDGALNLGTEVIGIVVTVWLIDASLRRQAEAERKRVRAIAFSRLRTAVGSHLDILGQVYKAATPALPAPLPETYEAMFSGVGFYEALARLDFYAPAQVSSIRPLQWMDYLAHDLGELKQAADDALSKFSHSLDSNDIEVIASLATSDLATFLARLPGLRQLNQQQGYPKLDVFGAIDVPNLASPHIRVLLAAKSLVNAVTSPDLHVRPSQYLWRPDFAPAVGSAILSSSR